MNFYKLKIPEVYIFEPKIHSDDRGFFYESYNQNIFSKILNREIDFVQDNYSYSKKGVVRGLHYQIKPFEQGKLVKVIKGQIFDVAVDIRKDSATYGKWVSEILSEENKKMIWIPEGFAHGFLSLANNTQIIYKTTNFYSKEHEKIIHFQDNNFSIEWPKMNFILSQKDKMAVR